MASKNDTVSLLAKHFIDIYGQNGTVYGENVIDFLSGITMSTSMLSRLTVKGECPIKADSLRPLQWTLVNASSLVSAVLDGVQIPACYADASSAAAEVAVATAAAEAHERTANAPLHVWGYGLLFVTLINLCAVLGIIFLPFMGRRVYKLLMTFMVSLAVGSLVATALLILLPDCLQLAFIHEEVNRPNSSLFEEHHHHVFRPGWSSHATWEEFISRHPWYLWRCCTVFAGIYLFFVIERLLKELIRWKQPVAMDAVCAKQHQHHHHSQHSLRERFPSCSVNIERVPTRADKQIRYARPDGAVGSCARCGRTNSDGGVSCADGCEALQDLVTGDEGGGASAVAVAVASHGHSHLASVAPAAASDATVELASCRTAEIRPPSTTLEVAAAAETSSPDSVAGVESADSRQLSANPTKNGFGGGGGGRLNISTRLAKVQPVAWMILLGDALHNFIDGLSIGAAFTRSTLSGISICLAVLCEELPHELGDFAILLSSGMSMPMALLCNFLSACTCYLGFALGVLLGETGASVWVFAIASGMFLYISLVDMMPEIGHSMEEPEAKQLGKAKIFVLQNLGLFMGFGAILLLAIYGGNIKIGGDA